MLLRGIENSLQLIQVTDEGRRHIDMQEAFII